MGTVDPTTGRVALAPLVAVAAAVWPGGRAAAQLTLGFEPVATGLHSPVGVVDAGDGSGRLFIVEQAGRILIHDGAQVLASAFLDVSALVSCCGEQGLLGLAFHPDYVANGLFYVDYTNTAGDTVIARYHVSADSNVADPASARILLTIPQPFSNHNGGQLAFGPDGFLYIGMGDGGSGGDPGNRAQNLGDLLGKLLRIDVDGAFPYAIPATNPFRNTPGARPEIWAFGLRNPWRFSFDRQTGDLFIADVGQDTWEEVDFQPATSAGGQNYGWRRMEGSHCFNPSSGCNDGTLTLPILEYDHSLGCSITGGYRYRGGRFPQLAGRYFYGDFCSGRIWNGIQSGQTWSSTQLIDTALQITSFGEDAGGELYVVHYGSGSNGTLQRIVELSRSFLLTVSRTGAGTGTVVSAPAGIDCGSVCSRTFGAGAVVTLTATPAAGSVFTGWSGGCSGTGPCTVTSGRHHRGRRLRRPHRHPDRREGRYRQRDDQERAERYRLPGCLQRGLCPRHQRDAHGPSRPRLELRRLERRRVLRRRNLRHHAKRRHDGDSDLRAPGLRAVGLDRGPGQREQQSDGGELRRDVRGRVRTRHDRHADRRDGGGRDVLRLERRVCWNDRALHRDDDRRPVGHRDVRDDLRRHLRRRPPRRPGHPRQGGARERRIGCRHRAPTGG